MLLPFFFFIDPRMLMRIFLSVRHLRPFFFRDRLTSVLVFVDINVHIRMCCIYKHNAYKDLWSFIVALYNMNQGSRASQDFSMSRVIVRFERKLFGRVITVLFTWKWKKKSSEESCLQKVLDKIAEYRKMLLLIFFFMKKCIVYKE